MRGRSSRRSTTLYAYVYGADEAAVRPAGVFRAEAMRYSDRWVREGCSMASSLIERERAALIRSYAALLAAVHQAPARRSGETSTGESPRARTSRG